MRLLRPWPCSYVTRLLRGCPAEMLEEKTL